MPDEAPVTEQETPQTEQPEAAPDGTPAPGESTEETPQFDPDNYVEKERYDNLRAEFDRRNPGYQLVEDLKNPDTRLQTLREIASYYQVDPTDLTAEELEDAIEEEQEFRDPRVDALIEEREYEQQERELDSLESHVDGEIKKLADEAGVDLSDDEVDLIFGALTPGENGPDVAKAFKKVTGLRDAHIKDYVAGKRRAPRAPSGSSPSHQPDLDDDEQRRKWLHEQAQQLSS